MAVGDRFYRNKAIVDPSYRGQAFSSNHIALNEDGDTGQSVPLSSVDGWVVYYDVATKAHVYTVSTAPTYTQTTSFSNFAALDVEPTQADLAALDVAPELLMRLHIGETVPELSFTDDNLKHYYPASEGVVGAAMVIDMKGLNATITGYTANCRAYFEDTNYGFSNLLFQNDADGIVTVIAGNNTVDYVNSAGSEIQTNFLPNLPNMSIIEVVNGELQDLDNN